MLVSTERDGYVVISPCRTSNPGDGYLITINSIYENAENLDFASLKRLRWVRYITSAT